MSETINLIFNGQPHLWSALSTRALTAFLAEQNIQPPFAVAVNRDFIPKAHYAQTMLVEGDDIEIVRAVTGG